ncbi:MAG: hypothetical protein Q4C96_00425 [Planctomycetia bacterium]|nr:hypothetical protein [Planctomycetia bacterium]
MKKLAHFEYSTAMRRKWQLFILIIGLILLTIYVFTDSQTRKAVTVLTSPPERSAKETLEDPAEPILPLPGLDESFLLDVEDDAGIFDKEQPAWNHLINLLKNTSDEQIQKHCLGTISYMQLSQQPGAYRGKIVQVRGTAQGVFERKNFQFPLDVPVLYEIWIKMEDAPGREPVGVYSLSLPEGFPVGQADLHEEISFSGLFYKRVPFATEDGLALAPILMAKSVVWKQKTSEGAAGTQNSLPSFWLVLLFAVLIAGTIIVIHQMITPENRDFHESPLPETFEWGKPEDNSGPETESTSSGADPEEAFLTAFSSSENDASDKHP